MNKETEETEVKNPYNLTKEDILNTIRDIFKDNEEALKHLDSIINGLAGIKKLDTESPRSNSFILWMIPILLLFGPSFDELDKDLLKAIKNETDKAII